MDVDVRVRPTVTNGQQRLDAGEMSSSGAESTGDADAEGRTTIWYFIPALGVGGAERTLVELANNVDRERFEVTIWTIFEQNALATEVADDVDVRTLGVEGVTDNERPDYIQGAKNPLDYLRIPGRFVRAVRRERPDIVQSFLIYDNSIARLAGLFAPETTVITGERKGGKRENRLFELLDRTTYRLSDYIVANSRAGAETYLRYGADPESVSVIHNGRDLDDYRDGDAEGLREELGLPSDVPVVGNVARLEERKGHYDVLAAWPSVRADHDAHCVVVGDGVEREALRTRARELGVADSVHFVGSRDDVPALLDLFDVFVFPSHYEGLPGALLEAMAAGCPIVASDIAGNRDLVTDGETGVLIPPRDPDAFADGLTEFLDDPERARAFGDAAQADAYERFTLGSMVSEFEQFYESVRSSRR